MAIPVAPGGPNPTQVTPAPSTPSTGGGGKSGSGSGGSKKAPETAQEKYDREASEAKKKAGNRYLDQAANLESQAKALKYALRNSYDDALATKLKNVGRTLRQQDGLIMEGFRNRYGALEGAVEDNEKAQGTQTLMNAQNLVRERNGALVEAMAQGAGESDTMQASLMSLRNWQANQGEVQRSLFDTLRSVNSSLTDLNTDTKTARFNVVQQANADREQLYTNYYNQRAESFTQLGNIRGQQADYLDMAKEYDVGKGGNTKSADKAFLQAAKEAGKSWENPGVDKKLRRWSGRDEFEAPTSNDPSLGPTVDLGKKPEGATLRTW